MDAHGGQRQHAMGKRTAVRDVTNGARAAHSVVRPTVGRRHSGLVHGSGRAAGVQPRSSARNVQHNHKSPPPPPPPFFYFDYFLPLDAELAADSVYNVSASPTRASSTLVFSWSAPPAAGAMVELALWLGTPASRHCRGRARERLAADADGRNQCFDARVRYPSGRVEPSAGTSHPRPCRCGHTGVY